MKKYRAEAISGLPACRSPARAGSVLRGDFGNLSATQLCCQARDARPAYAINGPVHPAA